MTAVLPRKARRAEDLPDVRGAVAARQTGLASAVSRMIILVGVGVDERIAVEAAALLGVGGGEE